MTFRFLTEAFTAAHDAVGAIFQKTHEFVDLANIMAIRLMTDNSFLHVDPGSTTCKWRKRAIFAYELGRRGALKNLHDTIDDAFTYSGAPKPSLTDILKDAAGTAIPYLSRPYVLTPIVLGLSATVLGILLYTANTGHLPHPISDLLAPFLGSGNGNLLRGDTPKPDP